MSKSKKKEPEEKKRSKLTRRSMLKMGAAAGAVTIIGPTILTSKKSTVYAQGTVAEPVLCNQTGAAPVSPATTPFVDNLPIPSPAIPTILNPFPTQNANIAGGEAARAPHQRWAQFPPLLQYQMEAKAATAQFHRDLLPSYVWAFNGQYPAPTLLNAYGIPSLVRFKNSLPFPTTSFGTPQITVHLHNGHTASESDGFAQDFFPASLGPTGGIFKDNHYANAYAGIDAFGGIGDPREAMHTFWFHDHHAGETANNNYLGLNGMYLVYNETDPGLELPLPGSLRLPNYYGITDIPLILTDKRFCAAANGRNEMFQVLNAGAPGGDKWVVNGKIQPKFAVRRRKYRFRVLNTGPAKTWNLSLIGPDGAQKTMTVVGVDANFLHQPVDVSATSTPATLDVFVAMRFDVVIDFSQFPVGSSVYLKEAAAQNVTGGGPALPDPAPGLPMANVLMRFDVVGNTIIPDTPPIPSTLVDLPPVPAAQSTFEWTFKLVGGRFKINDLEFDPNVPVHTVLKGSSEEWHLRNDVIAGAWVHPVHIHFEEGRMLERTLQTVPGGGPDTIVNVPLNGWEATDNARRDVYPLPGQNALKIRLAFRDFIGRYLIHCHNMNHEDAFMMVRWDIVDNMAALERARRDTIARRQAAGVDVEAGLPKEVQG